MEAGTVRLLALDVDGVLTDGRLYYSPDGVIQCFCAEDGYALTQLVGRGFPVALISYRDYPATRRRAADLGVKLLCLGTDRKAEALEGLCRHLSIPCAAALFMGDSPMDLPALRTAGVAACPSGAHPAVRAECDIVTSRPGGRGAVAEIAGMILEGLDER